MTSSDSHALSIFPPSHMSAGTSGFKSKENGSKVLAQQALLVQELKRTLTGTTETPKQPSEPIPVPPTGTEKVRRGDKEQHRFKTWSSKRVASEVGKGGIVHLKKRIPPRLSLSSGESDSPFEEKEFQDTSHTTTTSTSTQGSEEVLRSPPTPKLKHKRSGSIGEKIQSLFTRSTPESPKSDLKKSDLESKPKEPSLLRMNSDPLVVEKPLNDRERPKLVRRNSFSDLFKRKSIEEKTPTQQRPVKTLETLTPRDRQESMNILAASFNQEGICETTGLFFETGGAANIALLTKALIDNDKEKFKGKIDVFAVGSLLKKFISSCKLFEAEGQSFKEPLLEAGLNFYGLQTQDALKIFKTKIIDKMDPAKKEILRQFLIILEKVSAKEKSNTESFYMMSLCSFFATALVEIDLSKMSDVVQKETLGHALECLIRHRDKLLRGLDDLSITEQKLRMSEFLIYFHRKDSCAIEGIFRTPGQSAMIEDLQYALVQQNFQKLDEAIEESTKKEAGRLNVSPEQVGFKYEIGNLFKRFVTSCDLFDVKKDLSIFNAFIRAAGKPKDEAVGIIRNDVIGKMKEEKKKLLIQLFTIFKFSLNQVNTNLMEPLNLALMFSPSFAPQTEDIDVNHLNEYLSMTAKNKQSFQFLIENMDDIMRD